MISKVLLAKLSPTMEEGTVVKWLKQEGEAVAVGDVLAEIETDKANMEMEAMAPGVLRRILVPEGGKAAVGSLIGVIADPAEDIATTLAEATASTPAAGAASAPQPAQSPVTPKVETAMPATLGGRTKASPLARRLAVEHGLQIEAVRGSGPGGRVIRRDIQATVQGGASKAAAPSIAGEVRPLSSMRRVIASRLVESFFSAPHFYVTMDVNMDAAVDLREQLQRAQELKVSFNDLVVRACAMALVAHPAVNASWADDRIVLHGEIHVGVAVSIPDGLITPVVRNAASKSLVEISREVKELAGRARDRKLKPEEYTGSTFTVSNLGMYGVSDFTAIINPPESAILSVGAVRRIPIADGEKIRVGSVMRVTLGADHRVIDGALAAEYLARVQRLLENPASLLL
jgi:pyruvate dehydrogenase E2 component (dihydrolipoamide acetyltransferase)